MPRPPSRRDAIGIPRDIWSAGQGVGNIHDVLPTRELVARLIAEYADAKRRLSAA
jgi:nitronate monooxygenase